MQYRRFGRTELQMPVFSCGAMRYELSDDDTTSDVAQDYNQSNLEVTTRRAMELGITHVETARGYGTCERQLGKLLPKLREERPTSGGPEGLIVQTKVFPCLDANEFRRQVLDSLDQLQMDRIDLLALHGLNTYEILWHCTRPGGCLDVARQLQADGRVGHVGFSTHGPTDLIVEAINSDAIDVGNGGGFDYVNLHWYYINQWNWPAVEAATKRDMGVFIISPNDKGGMLYKPTEKLSQLCEPFHPIVFNSVFCLSRPEVHTLSIGASQPSDYDLQMSSLPLLEKADKLLPPILHRLQKAMVDAVGEEVANRFTEGLPAWDEDSGFGYMNLAVILWLRNMALAYDMTEYGKMRYNLLGNGGHWFGGLGAGHLETLDQKTMANALKKSPFADQIVGWLREAHELLGGDAVSRLHAD